MPKIHFLFSFREGPWGGGNQFMSALRRYFIKKGVYADADAADVYIINSHQELIGAAETKRRYPSKIFIGRVDGPARAYNNEADTRDSLTSLANRLIADATVFQSRWSRLENKLMGFGQNAFEEVKMNAPDPDVFRKPSSGKAPGSRPRLIAASWSANPRKGFDTYAWLDERLDFNKYEMVFIGNSPVSFKNIRQMPPLAPHELADELKKSDILIFASEKEACSNLLLEALHCGVPCIAFNGSSNPEVVGRGGELFISPKEIPGLIDKILSDYGRYVDGMDLPDIGEVGARYYELAKRVFRLSVEGRYAPKRLGLSGFLKIRKAVLMSKASARFPVKRAPAW